MRRLGAQAARLLGGEAAVHFILNASWMSVPREMLHLLGYSHPRGKALFHACAAEAVWTREAVPMGPRIACSYFGCLVRVEVVGFPGNRCEES